MKYRFPIATFMVILMLLFTEYAPSTSILQNIKPTKQLTLTDTSDPNVPIEAATLFKTDFENGYPDGIYDSSWKWHVVKENSRIQNFIFRNDISEQWSSFQFGSDKWENYAMSLKVKFLSTAQGQADTYIRISQSFEGYRASIWNNGWAGIGYYPPPSNIGGAPISIIPQRWYQIELQFVKNNLKYYIDGKLLLKVNDDRRSSGRAGFGVGPNTQVCVDDILVWGLDENGLPMETPPDLIPDPLDKYECDSVFCFINGSEPSMPVWNAASQGFINQPNDHREQIVIDENFAVNANEVATFENKIVWVRPHHRQDIQVYGTLIVNDSLLLWDQTEHQQTRLRIKKGGKLIIENSYSFQSDPFWVNWNFENGSTIFFNHFVGDPWCSIGSSVNYTAIGFSTVKLTLSHPRDTTLNVADAHHVWFELYPGSGNHVITLPEKRQWADWRISDLGPNTDVNVVHSYIYENDIDIHNDTHITVLDTPSGFSLGWGVFNDTPGFIDCELRNLGDPENDKGVFYENMTWDLPSCNSSLTVKNSLLQKAWPTSRGYVHLKIYNSNLADPTVLGPTATMEIYDSTIDLIFAKQGGKVYIENSKIRYSIQINDPNSVVYTYGVSSRDANNNFRIIEVDGGDYVELESPGPPW